MHERFIAVCAVSTTLGGYWGSGDTMEQATERMMDSGVRAKKHGKAKREFRAYRFTSDLPFAPTDREATETEADCWMGQNGSINWIRCDYSELSNYNPPLRKTAVVAS
jgi:hypothetical protein